MSKNNETEGLILLLDVGIGMSTRIRNTTYLQTCVDIIQMIVQRKMFQSSKDELALILYGTNETANNLWDGSSDHYSHVSVARPLSLVDWKLLDYIQNNINSTNINGDILDALVVSSDHFHEDINTNKVFKEKRIIVLTDFSSSTEAADKIDKISAGLSKHGIRVDVISPFSSDSDDDKENGSDGNNATTSSAANNNDNEVKIMSKSQRTVYSILKDICDTTNGALFSFDEALSLLSMYQAKSIRSAGTKYTMTIGTSFKLPIVSMIKCKEYKPDLFKFKKVYAKDASVELATDRARFTKDDEQRDLNDKSDLVDAYRYGSTYVPIDNADELRLKAEKCFSLLGFTKSKNIKRHYYLGDSVNQIVPDPAYGENAEEAFVNMVQAMYLDDVYAIVRRVFSTRSSPELGCLIPVIENGQPCLYYIQIPFEDDVRKFTLENFNNSKKYKPTEKQLNLIDELIDSMDLTVKKEPKEGNDNENDDDGDDEEEEPYDPHLTFNPYIQRMFQSIALKATNPDNELPDFENHITATHLAKIGEKIKTSKTVNILKRCAEEFPIKIDMKKVKKQEENIFHQKESNNENPKDEELNKETKVEDVVKEEDEPSVEVKKEELLNDEEEDLLDMM